MSDNFNELKRLFDAECALFKEKRHTKRGGRKDAAYVLAGMLHGLSTLEGRHILADAANILNDLADKSTVNVAEAYQLEDQPVIRR